MDILSIPRNGLVGEWLLDGNALDTNDGTKNNGTASNVTWVKTNIGYNNQCGSFNGSSSKVNLPNNVINNTNTVTVSAWARAVGPATTVDGKIFDARNASGGTNAVIILRDNSNGYYVITSFGTGFQSNYYGLMTNEWHMFTVVVGGGVAYFYIDGELKQQGNTGTTARTSTSARIGQEWNDGVSRYFNGQIQNVRVYNRVLTGQEIRALYLEGLRKIGPAQFGGYPNLFNGLVGYFEVDNGTQNLRNTLSGTQATRTAGTNTTDNLGLNKAISNPNYTWSSITYTAGYTYENSGSGWNIVTNPSGLSSTGINRTTTLRNIFLYNRSLSSDEVNTLGMLCSRNYTYPANNYDLPNLRQGLVLDLNEQGRDLSGNGNHGTLVNNPTVVNIGKVRGLTYNGSNQSTDVPHSSSLNIVSAPLTMSAWIRGSLDTNYRKVIDKTQISTANGYGFDVKNNEVRMLGSTNLSVSTTLDSNRWYHIACVKYLHSLGVGNGPGGIAIDGGFAYVCCSGSNRVDKINLSTFTNVGNVAVGNGPVGIAIDGGFAYVTCYDSNRVDKINLSTFTNVGNVGVGSGPCGIAIDGGFAYIACNNSVHKINLSTFTNVGNVSTGSGGWDNIIIHGGFAYKSCGDSSRIDKINLSTFTNVGNVSTGASPEVMAIDGGFLYVTCFSSNRVDKINLSTFTNVGNVAVGNGPIGIAIDGGFAYVCCSGSNRVDKINLATFTNIGSVATGNRPPQIIINGGFAYVSCRDSNRVDKFNLSTFLSSAIYVNGCMIGSGFYDNVNTYTGNLRIGAASDGTARFNGSIVEPRVYNRALSPQEIQQLYYSQKGNFIF